MYDRKRTRFTLLLATSREDICDIFGAMDEYRMNVAITWNNIQRFEKVVNSYMFDISLFPWRFPLGH
jgi:hypothetical protein